MKSIRNNLAVACLLFTVTVYGNNTEFDSKNRDKQMTENPLSVATKTVTVYGSGGYNTNTGAICPDSATSVCAYIVTDRHENGTWGPFAAIEMSDGTPLQGMIEEPIESPDGEVINFVFSSLQEL